MNTGSELKVECLSLLRELRYAITENHIAMGAYPGLAKIYRAKAIRLEEIWEILTIGEKEWIDTQLKMGVR